MLTSIHYFIHLNLAIALLLGCVVFVAGINTAVTNRVRSCILVTVQNIANIASHLTNYQK